MKMKKLNHLLGKIACRKFDFEKLKINNKIKLEIKKPLGFL